MVYKRATQKLIEAGITGIEIQKRKYGASPHLAGVYKQSSKCFKTWQEAAQAVIDGYRPTVIEAVRLKETERHAK